MHLGAVGRRIEWLDYCKGLAILLVVYRHSLEGIKRASFQDEGIRLLEMANMSFYSFRMPLFFILSGMFVSRGLPSSGAFRYLTRRAKVLLYVYFIWGIIQVTLQIIFSDYVNSSRTLEDYFHLLYWPRQIDHFWYLHALYFSTVVFVFVVDIFKIDIRLNYILAMLFYFFSAYCFRNGVELYFLSDVFHFYIFLVIGYSLSTRWVNLTFLNFRKGLVFFYLFVLFILFGVAQLYFVSNNVAHLHIESKYRYVEYYEPVIYVLIALIGSVFVAFISELLYKVKYFNWVGVLGRYSLEIYVSHVLFTSFTRIMLGKVLGIESVWILLPVIVFCGCYLPILLKRFVESTRFEFLFVYPKISRNASNPQK